MARRTRPRPRRKRGTPSTSRLPRCTYAADLTLPDPADLDHPLCHCGLPYRHPRHQPPDTHDAQDEHRRRIGDDQ